MSGRFLCLELEKNDPKSLLRSLFEMKSYNIEKYEIVSERFIKYYKQIAINTQKIKEVNYFYGNENLINLKNNFDIDVTFKTIAQASTFFNIPITDYTSLTSYQFQWLVRNITEIENSFFYTVMTENGIELRKPVRTGKFRGKIEERYVLGGIIQNQLDVVYQGETGGDYYISANCKHICPPVIDSTLKNMAVNKFLSLSNMIVFQFGDDWDCGDFIQYDKNYYVLMSKQPESGGIFVYTAVAEINITRTFVGADVIPGQFTKVLNIIYPLNNTIPVIGGTNKAGFNFINDSTGILSTDGFEVGIDASGNAIINNKENTDIIISRNGAEKLRLKGSNFGFLQSDPLEIIDVYTGSSGAIHIGAKDVGAYLQSGGSSELHLSGGSKYTSYSAPHFVHTAKAVQASGIYYSSGIHLWSVTGLTAGNTFNIDDNYHLHIYPTGAIVPGNDGLAADATAGFLYIKSCAGTPTGTPTNYSNRVPLVYDRTNNKLYIYNAGWKSATFA